MVDFNKMLGDFAAVQAAGSPPAKDTYRGWSISWDYGEYSATGPDYDASWEGEEDGWVDNGQRVFARTYHSVCAEVDAWIEEHEGQFGVGA